ncbi:MAG: TIGR02147 family protein [Bacteriovorax sp.]|nr:TIGR02147 family protein [Bacteriovorax sp.]
MSLFDYHDYKKYVNEWIEIQPKNGHGQLRKISQHLGINSVVMSQVFRGERDLTIEQALSVTQFIGLTTLERDYFLLLVQRARAGTNDLRKVFTKQLDDMKVASQALKNRIKHEAFTDEDRATFYSHWYFSAIRLGVSIPEHNQLTKIADHLNLERSLVAKVVEFLLKNKLIVEKKNKLDMGPQVTHVGHDSPFVNRHHSNWRLQGLQAMENPREQNLFYTGPMAISHKACEEIRKNLIDTIEKTTKKASQSESEILYCLNIDWFKIGN